MLSEAEAKIKELLEIHQNILRTQTNTIESMDQYLKMLGDAVVSCINMETEMMARIVLLERSVIYKELPDG